MTNRKPSLLSRTAREDGAVATTWIFLTAMVIGNTAVLSQAIGFGVSEVSEVMQAEMETEMPRTDLAEAVRATALPVEVEQGSYAGFILPETLAWRQNPVEETRLMPVVALPTEVATLPAARR
ncbi:hypothetical protein [Algicella marina]|uniref:Uncharacterized protein n=1 Tax=Algicella marina TaxID=2683284 RepID=A0A6P1SWS5_9RHOB|nr:hypothetical protein [Algicella marina]QHQ34110.1 hypothetical protein GO499_02375 [Algicella marina]